jgi:glycerol-3-phosphate dehydrogenase
LVDQVIAQLPTSRQQQLKPCRTASTPLRVDSFDRDQLTAELMEKFQLDDHRCRRMIEAWGADATTLLQECPSEWWEPIGESRYLYAELAGALRYECAANLCDLLERRLRLAALCPGQGLPELDRIGQIAGQVAGWSATRIEQELQAYRTRVQTRYQAQE